jgi:transposase
MNRCKEEVDKLHTNSLIKRLLRIDHIAIESVFFEMIEEEEVLIVRVRPYSRQASRCPICGKCCPGYDSARNIRRWRSLDLGSTRVYIEAKAPRVQCNEHGVLVAKVPWARHDSDYTHGFEMAVTWLTLHATATDVSEFYRIKWDTVGSIARRVQKALEMSKPSRFDDLEKIGIDETSYKKGHKYMTVVVDHNTGALIWARKGHGKEVLTGFFEELTEEQRAKIKLVSADGARWIADCIKDFCPNAERCIDPFHVVAWANDALDEVRKVAIRKAKQEVANEEKPSRSKKKKTRSIKSMLC